MYKVVLADDEATMRKALLTLVDWAALDCEVVLAAEDGKVVLDSLQACRPDIVISDIRMPRVDGLQLAQELARQAPGVQMILLTAFADFTYAQQAIRYHVSEYVVKSGALDKLTEAVERCKATLARERSKPAAEDFRQALKSVMDGSLCDAKELALLEQEVQFLHAPVRCAVLQIPARELADAQAAFAMLRRSAQLLADTLGSAVAWSFPLGGQMMCLLVRGISESEMLSKCQQAVESFFRLTGFRFYVGISAPCAGVAQLPAALAESRQAQEDSFYDVTKCVNRYAQRNAGSCHSVWLSRWLPRLEEALTLGAATAALGVLGEMCAQMRSAQDTRDSVLQTAAQVLALCGNRSKEAGGAREDASVDLLAKRLAACWFFSEVCVLLEEAVTRVCGCISDALEKRGDLVTQVQNYIDQHFREEISLSIIAAQFGTNASYLSRVFKAKSGRNIVNAITQKRMDAAKRLLQSNTVQVQEVAAAVGMENTTYFTHVFHKYTGMSPRAYQEIAQSRQRAQEE